MSIRGFLKTTALAVLAGVLVIAGGAFWLLRTPTPPPDDRDAPKVPRLTAPDADQPRVADAGVLLDWAVTQAPLAMVRTETDRLPNGLALAMVPFMVDWQGSRRDGDDPFVLVRNVAAGGNPVTGDTLLATLRVPLDGVRSLQWCLTPTRNAKGRDTFMGHAMLRFLFDPDRRPLVLDHDGKPLPLLQPPDDLMLSWEAWRPPGTSYDGLKGLDPSAYTLSARAYTGAWRFLTDVVRGNPWKCWPVALPDVDDAAAETLLTGLLIGDAMARRTIEAMVRDGSLELAGAERLAQIPEPALERAAALFSMANLPKDPLSALMGKTDLSYQLLERSCITESLAVVQLALNRIHARHDLGPPPEMDILPTGLPGWINDLSTADTGTLLSHVPGALLYVAMNQSVIPSHAYRILADAGLLESGADGAPLLYYYDAATGTPYGQIRDTMM